MAIGIVLCVVALVVGAVIGTQVLGKQQSAMPEAERQKLVEAARAEAEQIKRAAQLAAKEQALKATAEAERELKERRTDLQKSEEALRRREEELAKKQGSLQGKETEFERKEKTVAGREQAAEATAKRAEQLLEESKLRLEKMAGMSAEQAREELVKQVIDEAKRTAASEVKKIEDASKAEAEEKAKRILGTAIQRYAGEYVGEKTVSVVQLPSDDMKGRIIGREGRNVRALEAATGIDMIIDDTPEAVIISCFNPVRREIAKLALEKLIADGRIHPTRIEEVVAKCTDEVEAQCKEAGEQAVFDLGLHKVHPELVRALGRLKFRHSYAQNLLQHSMEVGLLAGIMAGELGLNVKVARRAGLLHDLGKSVDHEVEGPHAFVGAQLAKKFNESPQVCAAIAQHHGDEPHTSVLSHLVDAANVLSGQRPGARQELLASYVTRLHDLEKLAESFGGVQKAFAIQAGSELRVLVENATISDEQSLILAKDIAKRIEDEATYPGQVRVCVIRETRSIDYAK
ncbi:MAG TPA: ribonuclease Y [Kofleriaceae bacterium]|nr:ribonuclease Y [Kofleriaceae bacterium]